ncbi:hypothetical protein [Blastococcus haudaquaticus]|uniref:Uncharacterized protein n=1 Tax=Blastococcus haudaquaticus TaxID=1938745 RepID=A0A286GQR7_9ACTN|nr:hypothetical protein [Blastococcus haudaquaticus]SOD97897.1 hypothetical protein SAMN06272739_1654 [Blastococcus haudaquaticus]
MDLELFFEGLDADLLDAVVDVRVADLAVADAPADGPGASSGELRVSSARPSARISLDLPVGDAMYEPGLLVRVRGRTPDDGRIEFFTTSATPVTAPSKGPVRVLLSRIA